MPRVLVLFGDRSIFVGFPYKMDINLDKNLTGGRPTPFMKKGIISAMDFSQDASLMYIDAINNEGFSGGPLVFVKQGKPNNEYSVVLYQNLKQSKNQLRVRVVS